MSRPQDSGAHWSPPTEIATRLLAREDDESPLVCESPDIGRLTAPNARELFVTCAAVDALELQFSLRAHLFVYLHGLLSAEGARFLQATAHAQGVAVQTLSIRRQGFGDQLASLSYIDLPVDGHPQPARIYALGEQAPGVNVGEIPRAMLAHAAMTVLLVPGVDPALIQSQIRSFCFGWQNPPQRQAQSDEMSAARAASRLLVWLPLGKPNQSDKALAAQVEQLLSWRLRHAPLVRHPAEAWPYLSSTMRLAFEAHRSASAAAKAQQAKANVTSNTSGWVFPIDAVAAARGAPLDLPPIEFHPVGRGSVSTPAPAPAPQSEAQNERLEQLARDLASLSDEGASLILEASSSRVCAQVVRGCDTPSALARLARLLMATTSSTGRLRGSSEPACIEWSAGNFHACLRPVPGQPEYFSLTVIQPACLTVPSPWRAALARVEGAYLPFKR